MGAQCARSYQAEKTSRVERSFSTATDTLRGKQIFICVGEWVGNYSRMNTQMEENLIWHRILADESVGFIKFKKGLGFQNSFKPSRNFQDELLFQFYKNDLEEPVIQFQGATGKKNKVWKKISPAGSVININDQIKLGNNIMKLKYFHNQDQIKAMKSGCEQIKIQQVYSGKSVCRICKNEQKGSPFIMPCLCKDLSQVVHQKCFSREIFDQSLGFEDHKMAFKFVVKKNTCQFCHQSYQNYIWKRFLCNLTINDGYYAIMQRTIYSQDNVIEGIEYLVMRFTHNNQHAHLGRSSICDYSIPEVDLQKIHAKMLIKNGALYIFDNRSKTGTYIEHKESTLSPQEVYCTGPYVVKFEAKNKVSTLKKNKTMKEERRSTR